MIPVPGPPDMKGCARDLTVAGAALAGVVLVVWRVVHTIKALR